MIIRIEEIQSACSKILAAVNSNKLSSITDTLEMFTSGKNFFICVTNKEYYVRVRLEMPEEVEFKATVNANLFLKLISQITTETIELNINENSLVIKGNGTYKLPLIFEGETMLELPEIKLENPTIEFNIDSNILLSILQYNSKELLKGLISKPIQKLYYMDENGAVTFTTGACVNDFKLEKPVKVLLNDRLVKLFKLFKGESVSFTMAHDAVGDGVEQTKVKFESDDVMITAAISCDDSMLESFPVNAVRGRADAAYPYSININKEQLIQTINRLLLFTAATSIRDRINPFSTFEFMKNKVVIWDTNHENFEEVYYSNTECAVDDKYTALFDFNDLEATLETCTEQYVTIAFGDSQAMVITRGNVKNVIPECRV